MQKNYDLSNWARSPGGQYHLAVGITKTSDITWYRDPNGAYHLTSENSGQNTTYTFSIGTVNVIDYDKTPTVTTEQNNGDVVFDFSFPQAANAYQVAVENGYTGTESEWLTSLKGVNGTNGLSAYQVATNSGYTGTVEDWLDILKGEEGPQGIQGIQGPAGLGLTNKGNWVSGSTYERGDYVFATTNKNDGGYAMFVVLSENSFTSTTQPDQDATNWEQIYAPQGPQGPQGNNGTDGLSTFQIAVANGYSGTESEWLSSLKGDAALEIQTISCSITKS